MSEIEDRRQRACEAFWDHMEETVSYVRNHADSVAPAAEAAIEVAMQVNISDDIVQAFVQMPISRFMSPAEQRARIASTLAVIGFEVIG